MKKCRRVYHAFLERPTLRQRRVQFANHYYRATHETKLISGSHNHVVTEAYFLISSAMRLGDHLPVAMSDRALWREIVKGTSVTVEQ